MLPHTEPVRSKEELGRDAEEVNPAGKEKETFKKEQVSIEQVKEPVSDRKTKTEDREKVKRKTDARDIGCEQDRILEKASQKSRCRLRS